MNRVQLLKLAHDAAQRGKIDYGTVEQNFGNIARLWTTYGFRLSVDGSHSGMHLRPMDVAMAMILVKVARQMNMDKIDNLVDIAGYAACAGELVRDDTAFSVPHPSGDSPPAGHPVPQSDPVVD